MSKKNPLVSIVMGSQSDWKTLSEIEAILNNLSIIYEKKIISAHRTPIRLFDYAKKIENTSVKVIIPSSTASTSIVALSVSISANISPAETVSPTLTNHLLITPSDIVGDNAGIKTLIAIYFI